MEKRTIPVCCTDAQYLAISKLAKSHGMIDAGQALEQLLKERK